MRKFQASALKHIGALTKPCWAGGALQSKTGNRSGRSPVHKDPLCSQEFLTCSADTTAACLLERMRAGQRTYFVRFGDSEIRMLKDLGHSSKSHINSAGLRKELQEAVAIDDNDWILAPGIGLDVRGYYPRLRHRPELDNMAREILPKFRPLKMFANCHALTIKFVYYPEWFIEFCEALQAQKPILIAGPALCRDKKVHTIFGISDTVECLDKNSYKVLDSLMPEIHRKLEAGGAAIVVLASAGKALALRLWRAKWPGYFLDPGSVINAIQDNIPALQQCGISRGWIETLVTDNVMRPYRRYIASRNDG